MFKSKKRLAIIITTVIISAVAILTAVIGFDSKTDDRGKPMVCYGETIYVRSNVAVDVDVGSLKYVGKIIYIVPENEIPSRNFECNSNEFLNTSLYSGIGNEFYLELKNGNFILLEKAEI